MEVFQVYGLGVGALAVVLAAVFVLTHQYEKEGRTR